MASESFSMVGYFKFRFSLKLIFECADFIPALSYTLKPNAVGVAPQIFGALALIYAMVLLILLGMLILLLRGDETGDGSSSNCLSNTTAISWVQVSIE